MIKKILTLLVQKGADLGAFTPKEAKKLIPDFPIPPTFRHLPKVHKGIVPVQGRPIVLGIGFLNEHWGEWVDGQLQSIAHTLLSYLRDTNHLLDIMDHFPWENEFNWLSCDVASLYSSIPHHLALEAVSYWLKFSTEMSSDLCSFILEDLDYLLTHNFFLFNGVFYLQRCGALIGAIFSPPLAN